MRRLMTTFGIIYLIGIGVQIWPQLETQWDTVPASRMVSSLVERMPSAATWPIRAWESARDFTRAATSAANPVDGQ